MNSVIEKEKRLTLALTKLKNLNYKNSSIKKKHRRFRWTEKSITNWKTRIRGKIQKIT